MKNKRIGWAGACLSFLVLSLTTLFIFSIPSSQAAFLDSTTLTLSPSDFQVESGDSVSFTATLTSEGDPISGKDIVFTTTWGTFSPISGTVETDQNGQATITYNAPSISTDNQSVSVTATFIGDLSYGSSSDSASGNIQGSLFSSTTLALSPSSFTVESENSVSLTAKLTSKGTALSGKTITFSTINGTVDPITGKTNSDGEAEVTYTAPSFSVSESVTVKATFVGDLDYKSSSAEASGTIESAELFSSTSLELSPSTFEVGSENSISLTAILTSEGSLLENKTITFTTPDLTGPIGTDTTNSEGKATVTYTAPSIAIDEIPVVITATFAGDMNYQTSTATSSGTIRAESLVTTVSKEGAAFQIPETIEEKIPSYKEGAESISNLLPIPIPTTGFLLATNDSLSLVLSDQSDKGIATVKGWTLTSDITIQGASLNVILAENVTFDKTGKTASVGEIVSNPEEYRLDLVKVSATRRHLSLLLKLENSTSLPITAGYIVENPQSAADIIKKSIDTGKNLAENPSKSYIKSLLKPKEPRLGVFDFETDYWIDSPAETNGIVLTSGPIFNKLKEILPEMSEFMQLETNIPVLYDVKTSLNSQQLSSVEEITQNPSKYRDEIVSLTSNEYGVGISVQEALQKGTGIKVPVDIRLEGSINWNNINLQPKMNEFILATGASSKLQNDTVSSIKGRFTLTGRVATAKQIDESLPEKPILLIYDKKRVGDINWKELETEAQKMIENELKKLNWSLSGFTSKSIPGLSMKPPEETNVIDTPETIPENVNIKKKTEFLIKNVSHDTPVEVHLENSKVSKVKVNFSTNSENVNISIKKIEKEDAGVPEPSGQVYSYHEIRIRTTQGSVEKSKINFKVSKEWIEDKKSNEESIKLIRYHNGSWENLSTTLEQETATHFLYSSEVPGFSIFAITAETTEETQTGGPEQPSEEGSEEISPFVIGAVIVGVSIIIFITYRDRKTKT